MVLSRKLIVLKILIKKGGILGTKPYYYEPLRPYTIQKNNKTLEVLMFLDYCKLVWQYNKLEKEAEFKDFREISDYHKHLEWLIERGEDRIPKAVCPHCRSNIVKFYYYEWSKGVPTFSIDDIFCQKCALDKIVNISRLLRFKFSNLKQFYKYGEYNFLNNILPIYKMAFKLPDRITKEIAFKFFKESHEAPPLQQEVSRIQLTSYSRIKQLSLF